MKNNIIYLPYVVLLVILCSFVSLWYRGEFVGSIYVGQFVLAALFMLTLQSGIVWSYKKMFHVHLYSIKMSVLGDLFTLGGIFFLMYIDGFHLAYLLLFAIPMSDLARFLFVKNSKTVECIIHKKNRRILIRCLIFLLNTACVFLYGFERITVARLCFFFLGLAFIIGGIMLLFNRRFVRLYPQETTVSNFYLPIALAFFAWGVNIDVETWQLSMCWVMGMSIAWLCTIERRMRIKQ